MPARTPSRSAPARPRGGTFSIFLALTAGAALLAWVNETFVMTPDLYRELLAERFEPEQVEQQLALNARFSAISYAAVPIQLGLTLGWTALIVQMVCLTGAIEIRFGQAYRAAAFAYPATLYGAGVQLLWLVRRPPATLDATALATVPDSVAKWVSVDAAWMETLLGYASVTQVLWVALLYVALRHTAQLTGPRAAAVTAASWSVLTLVKFSATLLFQI